MKQKTLKLMEDAISSAGSWTWIETSHDSIQLDFEDVQLYKSTLEKHSKHSSEITIRLADNPFFTIFYNDSKDLDFLNIKDIKDSVLFANDFSYKIAENGLKFQNFIILKEAFNDYKHHYNLLDDIGDYNTNISNNDNDINTNNINNNIDVDFLLVFILEDIAIACGANQINFFNDFESLNDLDIKKLSNQWWIYWVDYWKSKKTKHEYEYDPACEIFSWI
ncbi:hypothetical protein [Methanobrevibacter sp.]|uniref:hypothetical protein n=1 Tax=Methanobrevibacter sp. TaxID=66852 RepID=UPI0026230F5C|nr:hypothetical protein [uncultured Methanobrevibacter sp.]